MFAISTTAERTELNHTCMAPHTVMHPSIKYPYLYTIVSETERERRARAITFVHFTQGYASARACALYQLRAPGIPSGLSSIFPYYERKKEGARRAAAPKRDAKIRIRNVFSGKTALTHSQAGNKLAFDANHEREKIYMAA
jgi:hypothetical protein